MKRILMLLLAAALLLAPAAALAEFDYSAVPTPAVIVTDGYDTGEVFFERGADTRAYPASTTKIMTCILALESGRLDEQVTVGNEVLEGFTKYSSLLYGDAFMQVGEQYTLRDLVYGLMLVSGNDAGAAIAVHVGGSIEGFVALMNDKAAELGMKNTHFANPHGVHSENHYTTARDMAKLTAYALQNDDFRAVCATKTYTLPGNALHASYTLSNTNKLVRKPDSDAESYVYEFAIGIKTGDTNAAGKCLVAAAEKDGARLIAVLLGDTADLYGGDAAMAQNGRFIHAAAIFEDIFSAKYELVSADTLGLPATVSVPVSGASPEDAPDGALEVAVPLAGVSLRALPAELSRYRADAASITVETRLVASVEAPVAAGTYLGDAIYSYKGRVLASAALLAPKDVRAYTEITTQPGDPGSSPAPGAPSATAAQGEREPGEGISPLLLVLIGLVVLLIVVIALYAAAQKKARERARRRRKNARRQRRADQSGE